MKFLLKLIIVVLSIVAILLIVALFVDGNYSVSRSIEIERSQADVAEYITHLENQKEYSVWYKKDPALQLSTSGTDGTVGFISRWSSKNDEVGKGEQEITKIIDEVGIDTEIRFKEPMELTSNASIRTTALHNTKCSISWTFYGETPYPFNLMALFIDMEKEIGPDLENGLKNLKVILESEKK